jgi:hypothetical protein
MWSTWSCDTINKALKTVDTKSLIPPPIYGRDVIYERTLCYISQITNILENVLPYALTYKSINFGSFGAKKFTIPLLRGSIFMMAISKDLCFIRGPFSKTKTKICILDTLSHLFFHSTYIQVDLYLSINVRYQFKSMINKEHTNNWFGFFHNGSSISDVTQIWIILKLPPPILTLFHT